VLFFSAVFGGRFAGAFRLAGFYVVSGGHWERLLVCLLGFVTARLIVTRLIRPPIQPRNAPAKEAFHAP
jgi:F1F0 ATPase subunit 2